MKLLHEVLPQKLRGGYYTPPEVVQYCLRQVRKNCRQWPQTWLEPSSGDGAFLRGLGSVLPRRDLARFHIDAIELIDQEAAKCEAVLDQYGLCGDVVRGSFFPWASENGSEYDAVVGNPPYVRYQFLDADDQALAEAMLSSLGVRPRGVSNLWIPFAILALAKLRIGGCFSLVLPSELLCTSSGGEFRSFLIERFDRLEIDLFPRGTFRDVLQDIVVVSGRRARATSQARTVRFAEHEGNSQTQWDHEIPAGQNSWLSYLLTAKEHAVLQEAKALQGVYALGDLARLEVAIVTGANDFFTVSQSTLDEYDLHAWALPLLARTSDAPGVVFTPEDHAVARDRGNRCWLLDFAASRPTPNGHGRVSEYLAAGEAEGLPLRYKCRIREPWYRVPHIKSGSLMMTKRAHHYHRLLLNEAGVYTTDTVYRGAMRPLFAGREGDLVAAFQNTLTLLTSETEGRTYGGGVLELVPSEVARLSVPLAKTGKLLRRVDAMSRSVNGQRDASHRVMRATDEFLCEALPGYRELLPILDGARERLRTKRQTLG